MQPMPRPAVVRETDSDENALPQVLVMTMVRDEAAMLPRWIRHYAAEVGMENLVVLDDGTTDGSTDGLACTVHRLPPLRGRSYEGIRMKLASGLAAGFLSIYDFVVFVDADEFLVADPAKYRDLRCFLAARPDLEVVAPMALNVVHVPSVEGQLRPDEPVLGQRRFAKFTPVMCKPSIKRTAAPWRWASHGIEAPYTIDPELYMLHLKFADRDALRQVAAHRRALVEADGRGRRSTWRAEADDIVAILDEATRDVDVDLVPEFDPVQVKPARIVREQDGWFRSVGRWQIGALKHQRLRRVPAALLGRI